MSAPIRVSDHLGLAHMACRSYRHHVGRGFDYDDLFQAACLGLIDAARTFDPALGRFSTHAIIRARRAVQVLIDTQSRTVRIPRTAQVAARTASRAPERPVPDQPRARRTSGAPFDWSAAPRPTVVLQVTHSPYQGEPSTWRTAPAAGIHAPSAERSLDFEMGADGGSTLHDVLGAPGPDPESLAAERELADWARHPAFVRAFRQLGIKEQIVIRDRLRGSTQVELAADFEVSKQRIEQIEAGAVAKLRIALAQKEPQS